MQFDRYILVTGPDEEKVTKAVQLLSDLYADSGFTTNITLYAAKEKQNTFLINFGNQPDFERFKYFVNYLAYPEVKNYQSKVAGYWTITDTDDIHQDHLNQRALLYISENDTEGDNVYAVFQGGSKTIKLGFAKGEKYKVLKHKEFDFTEVKWQKNDFDVLKIFNPKQEGQKAEDKKGCLFLLPLLVLMAFVFFVSFY